MMPRPSRIVDDPTVADRLRTHVRRAQEARIGGNLAPQLARLLVAVREEPPPGPSTTRHRWLAPGIVVACVVFGLASSASDRGRSEPAYEPLRVAAPPEPAPPESVRPEPAPLEPAPLEPAPNPADRPSPAIAPQLRTPDTRSVHDLPAARRPPVEPQAGISITLEDEIAQLAEVRALSASDPARSLSAAEAGHQRFRSGVLYQEREAIAIDALRRLHRLEEAHRRARQFLRTYPDSPFAKRVGAGVDDP